MGQQEGEEEAGHMMAKTCVWWDIDNCAVPKGCDANAIAKNISSALADRNYRGPVSISAYGDTHRIPASVQHALTSTGVSLHHVPAGVKDASDKKILVRMLLWAMENPPPANYFLISGDRDFSDALHQLRMKRYNILVAQPQKASAPLVAAAKTVWLWTTLVAGGPPLVGGESEQFASNGHSSVSDSRQIPVSDPIQTQQAVNSSADHQSGTRKSPSTTTGNGVKRKGKATQKNMIQANETKASTMSGLNSSMVGEASVTGGGNAIQKKPPPAGSNSENQKSPSAASGNGGSTKWKGKATQKALNHGLKISNTTLRTQEDQFNHWTYTSPVEPRFTLEPPAADSKVKYYFNFSESCSSFEIPSTWQPQKHGLEEYMTQNMSSVSDETMKRRYYDFPEHSPSSTSESVETRSLGNDAESVGRGTLRPTSFLKHIQDIEPALAFVIFLFFAALVLIFSKD